MDGVSWSTTRAQESFTRVKSATDTLSRLASFIATKQHTGSKRQPSHLPTYECQECGKGFPFATDLLNHQEVEHTLPKPHRCSSCGQEFSLKSSLQLHACSHGSPPCELCHEQSELASPCPACTTHTSEPSRLHLLDGSPYACAPCGRGFNQKQALLHHQQAGCSETPSPSNRVDASSLPDDSPTGNSGRDCSNTPGPSSRAVNVCRFCSKTFYTDAGLQRHYQTNHAEEQRTAPQGQKTKGEDMSAEARKKVTGDLIKMPKSKMKLLECRSCDMVFRNTSKLHMHRKEKHSRENNIRNEPMQEIRRIRRPGTYPCQICGKVLLHHLSLKAHYRQHAASNFATIKNNSQSVECTTQDSTLSETRQNEVKTIIVENKTVKAGPARPRKEAKLKNKVTEPVKCKKVEEEEEEDEEDEEELEREFPCPSCAEVFSLQSQLREHVELHQSSVRRRQCSVCTHEMDTCKFPGSKRQRLYHCVPCQQGFSALDCFLEHCQEHLRVRVEEDNITEGYTHQASKA